MAKGPLNIYINTYLTLGCEIWRSYFNNENLCLIISHVRAREKLAETIE